MPHKIQVRRATVEDLPTLNPIWISMRLPSENLESRVTEFQVVTRDGEVVGAIGFEILRTAGRLHSEGYSDYSVADTARELFWQRIQTLSANHGIFRLWTQENSPFWQNWGFQNADAESLARLPEEWKSFGDRWLTLELKNEAVITAALEKQFAGYLAGEKKQADDVIVRAKKFTNVVTAILLTVGFAGLALAAYLFIRFGASRR